MNLLLHYSWMVLYYLIAMAVMICAELAFLVATEGWRSPSKVVRCAKGIASWTVTALVLWLAFWHQHVVLWVVFGLIGGLPAEPAVASRGLALGTMPVAAREIADRLIGTGVALLQ